MWSYPRGLYVVQHSYLIYSWCKTRLLHEIKLFLLSLVFKCVTTVVRGCSIFPYRKPAGTQDDVELAVEAASEAFESWSKLPGHVWPWHLYSTRSETCQVSGLLNVVAICGRFTCKRELYTVLCSIAGNVEFGDRKSRLPIHMGTCSTDQRKVKHVTHCFLGYRSGLRLSSA